MIITIYRIIVYATIILCQPKASTIISIRKSCILALDLVTIQSRSSPSSFNNASERNSRKTRKRRQRKIRGSNRKDGRRKTRVDSHCNMFSN